MMFLRSMPGAENPLRLRRRLSCPLEFRNRASLALRIRTSHLNKVDRHLFPESSPGSRLELQIRNSNNSNRRRNRVPTNSSASFPSSSNECLGFCRASVAPRDKSGIPDSIARS